MRPVKLVVLWIDRMHLIGCIATMSAHLLLVTATSADMFFFSTGTPDGRIAMASREPNSQIEAADDFVTTAPLTVLTSATFTGLITGGVPLINIGEVNIDLYHVFPVDSTNPPSGNAPTRVNSPSDVEFDGRNSTAGNLVFVPGIINASFTAANSILNGIHPIPSVQTGGEGPVTGQEVQFNVLFTTPPTLPADHYFFVPTVQVNGGEFFWLSAPKPIVAPGTTFSPDLQAWTRNTALDPNWLRVGTDIVNGSAAPTFNATFSLSGQAVPEPSSLRLLGVGLVVLGIARRGEPIGIWRRRRVVGNYSLALASVCDGAQVGRRLRHSPLSHGCPPRGTYFRMMMNLKARLDMRIRFAVAVALTMMLLVTSARGVTLSSVGSQYDIGGTFFPGGAPPYVVVPWRSDISTKMLDADSNNVYGSAGYALFATQFNWPNIECCGSSVPFDDPTYPNMMNLPAFVDASQNLTANKVGGWVYALIDDPTLVNGFRDYNWGDTLTPSVGDLTGQPHTQSPYVKLGIVDGTDLFGNDPKTSSFGAGRWAFQVGAGVPSSFRVGVMTDGLDANQWAATEVLLAQVSGSPVPAIVGTPVSSGSLTRNRFVDMHFFDVVGAQPGDRFAIFAKASNDGNGAISGITFDVSPPMVLPGDFNGNGVVDAADYVVWRKTLGQLVTPGSGADGTGPGGSPDGVVDTLDDNYWRARFGNPAGAGSALGAASVPEPTTLVLLMFAAAVRFLLRRRAA